MKITQLIKSNNTLKVLAGAICVILFFFGLSFIGNKKKDNNDLIIDMSGFNKVYADSLGWGGVRGVATLMRAASISFNNLYRTISAWKFLDYEVSANGTIPGTDPAITFKIRINDLFSAQGTVDSGAVEYTNRIELSVGGTQALQLWFDNPKKADDGQGCLLIVKPYYFNSTCTDPAGIFEARVKPDSTNKIMYITFQGTPWTTGSATCNTQYSWPLSGRCKLVDDGTNYDVSALAKIHVVSPLFICAGGEGDAYYSLVFRAYKDAPNYCTALFGWHDTARSNLQCSFDLFNKGYFNSVEGYVVDRVDASNPVRPEYPLLADVDSLYTTFLAATEFAPATIDSPGVAFKTFDAP